MNVSIRYSSHLPVLLEAMKRTTGDVLELGPGVFSTPLLHWLCWKDKRNILTIESNKKWLRFCMQYYRTDFHKFFHTENYNDAPIEKEWDVVFVDHSPFDRRVVEIKRLANLAKYIVVHDSDKRKDRKHHLSTIYPLFKYRFDFTDVEPATTVLSNFFNLDNFI